MFAELKDPVRRKIERYGLTRTIDPRHFFPTIEAAVAAFRQETGAQWAPPARRPTARPPRATRLPASFRRATLPHHRPPARDKGIIVPGRAGPGGMHAAGR